ncbi:MAG: molybdopterin-dependent oxidoreductase [Chloroflexi bacterium]|nr:molybdopterin-dependent oxidoreductase [Chloroflexota bacterium]
MVEPSVSAEEPVFTGFLPDSRMGARASTPIIAEHGYLTPQGEWGDVERGNPLPYTLPPEIRRQVGLERDTWRLEIVADPETDAEIDAPQSIDFDTLVDIGRHHGVRLLKGVTCNNIGEPLGMGLWEGVPLRVLVWMARPVRNIRRVFYYGYHSDDPRQMFQSSLPFGRVLEEPPGELPVLVAYKLNGEFLTGKRGGPVRMLVPEAYGFKSVKWLQRVILTNKYAANDTYHEGNNDLDSPMKTFARFSHVPASERGSVTMSGLEVDPRSPCTAAADTVFSVSGIAQVGVSGLARVEWWLRASGETDWDATTDPYCERGDWQTAEILGPPSEREAMDLSVRVQREEWPLRYTFAYWRATLPPLAAGEYELRCRSVDLNGNAQPMPRPFAKSGRADIQRVLLRVQPSA